MRCSQCGFVNSPLNRFCSDCGAYLAADRPCPACGLKNRPHLDSCERCGADLGKYTGTAVPGSPDPVERRHLTVMFCVLVGSTALSEQLDPEELSELLGEAAAAAITRFEGYVARYIGDAILAYFGYPRAHDDDPTRAVHAALDIVAAINGLTVEGIRPQVRIGIHTGLVVVGDLTRGAVRENAGVVGETPNLAARIIALAAPDSVLMSGVTYTLVKNRFKCRELGPTTLRGFSRAISIHQVIGVRDRESGTHHNESTSLTVFTRREHELAFLRDRWQKVLEGKGQAISIVGEPGIGKSRLVRAFSDGLVGSDHVKTVFHCSPHFSNSAFFPFIDYLKHWLNKAGGDQLQQLENVVTAAAMSAAAVVPVLASVLSLPLVPPYRAPQASA